MPKWGEGPPAGGVERVRGVLARARATGLRRGLGQRAALGLWCAGHSLGSIRAVKMCVSVEIKIRHTFILKKKSLTMG